MPRYKVDIIHHAKRGAKKTKCGIEINPDLKTVTTLPATTCFLCKPRKKNTKAK